MGINSELYVSTGAITHRGPLGKDLHGAGYVHRDLKPGNIMFLLRTKRWTLIDFGCSARTGTHARTGFSLFYAAPEALKAYMLGEGSVQVTEALDAWSLGMLAIELLTGNAVFDHKHPKEQVFFANRRYLCFTRTYERDMSMHNVTLSLPQHLS